MDKHVSRRRFLAQSAAGAGTAALASANQAASTASTREATAPAPSNVEAGPERRPNILFIMTDQQRFDCLGANGNPIIRTPNLDRLAARSANFSHTFVQSPVCVPSRACFFTGRYAHAHRNRVNYTPLDRDEVLLPAYLRKAGYQTALVGKTHLYYAYPPTPEEARRTGFDRVELHDGVPYTDAWSDYAKWRSAHDPLGKIHYRRLARSVARLRDELPPGANPYRAAIDDRFTDTTWTGLRSRNMLEALAADDRPFFLFSSFWKPHSPFEVPTPFDAMYSDVEIPLPAPETLETIGRLPPPLQSIILRGKRPPYDMDREQLEWAYRSYYGSISHIDREVGLLLDTLEATGQADRTIIVFSSDHGDQLLEHGLLGKNVFFEASVRVPFMISLPGRIEAARYDELVETIDLLPTLFDLVGLPEPYACQGRSLAPLLVGQRKPGGHDDGAGTPRSREAVFSENIIPPVAHPPAGRRSRPREAVFSENVIPEVITNGGLNFAFQKGKGILGTRHPDAKMVRTRRFKYNYYPEGFAELYDLENDPHEQRNLAGDAKYKPVEQEMKGRLLDWLLTASETDQIAPRWLIPKKQR